MKILDAIKKDPEWKWKLPLCIIIMILVPLVYLGCRAYQKAQFEKDFPSITQVQANPADLGNFTGTVEYKDGKPVRVTVPNKPKRKLWHGNTTA